MIAKICGITSVGDAQHAIECGATALGFVFWRQSPRYIAPERAADIIRDLPHTLTTVGVFVNETVEEMSRVARIAGVTTIQLHGDEPAAYAQALEWPVWRAVSLDRAAEVLSDWPLDTTVLLDAHDEVRRGGTGSLIDWRRAADVAARRRVVLAGGLTPENVAQAIAAVHPAGVDVSTGVEETPGVKSFDKVARFLERARAGFNGH